MFSYKPKFQRDIRDTVFLDRKLDVALKGDDITAFQNYLVESTAELESGETRWIDPDYDQFIRSLKGVDLAEVPSCTSYLPKIMDMILNRKVEPESTESQHLIEDISSVWSMVKKHLEIQLQYNLSSAEGEIAKNHLSDYKIFQEKFKTIHPVFLSLFCWQKRFASLIESLPEGWIRKNSRGFQRKMADVDRILEQDSNSIEWEESDIKIVWSRTMSYFRIEGKEYIMPASAIQQIHNKISDHISVLLFSLFAEDTYLPENAFTVTLKFLKLLHRYHLTHPKSFFSFAASLEAIGMGILIQRHEQWDNDEFLQACIDAVNDDHEDAKEWKLRMDSHIVKLLRETDSALVAELICLSKMSGHPLTETEGGLKKLHQRTNKPRSVKIEAIAWTANSLKEDYIREYFITNNKRYPPMEYSEDTHPRMKLAFRTGRDLNDPGLNHLGTIENKHWSTVTLKKHMDVDYLENMLPHLKDTTISHSQSKVYKKFLKNREDYDPNDWKFERCLLAFIMGRPADIDHVSFAKEFGSKFTSVEEFIENFAIKLVEKEKELKLLARFFGCQTYLGRSLNQVIIKFCKKFLEHYSSHQALVLSELELIKKMYAFSKMERGDRGLLSLTVCCDVKSWNNNFTVDTVGPPSSAVLDAITGTELFSKAHEAFEHALLYNIGREKVTYWEGQLGGIEGLLQELWMIVYIQQLRYSLRDCAYKFDILCKGDDVRVRFLIPKKDVQEQGMANLAAKLKMDLREGLDSFGHEVKLQESWASSAVMAFSKKIYVEDVALTSSFRQIQKCYGAHNAFHTSLDDYIASAFSNAHSATGYGINQIAPYLVATTWSFFYLKDHPSYRDLNESEMVSLMLIPAALGGFPIIYLHNMFVRAESDLVSAFCGLGKFVERNYPDYLPYLQKGLSLPVSQRKPLKLLLADPYSLPINRPSSAKSLLIRKVREKIRRSARNRTVRALFDRTASSYEKDFIRTIFSADYYDAKLSSAVYECSPCTIQDQFIQKFTSSKSMIRFLVDTGESQYRIVGLLNSMNRREAETHSFRRSILFPTGVKRMKIFFSDYNCPTVLAEQLRNQSWGFDVNGITYPPIQHQTLILHEHEAPSSWFDDHFVYEVKPVVEITPHLKTPHFSRMYGDPFLGDSTPSGTYAAPVAIDTYNIIVNNVKKLLMLLTTVNLDTSRPLPESVPTFHELILKVLESYVDLTPEEREVFTNKRKSGTRTHHLAARGFRLEILPNQVKNMMSHVKTTTNTHSAFRNRSVNYRLNFLHLLCHNVSLLLLNWSFPKTISHSGKYWATVPECPDCLTEIDERNTIFADTVFLERFPYQPKGLRSGIDEAQGLLEQYILESEMSMDFRVIAGDITPTLQDSQHVIASELAKITIQDQQLLALGYDVIRPTVETLRDLSKLKGRGKFLRSLTGTEIVKLPGMILAMELIPHVVEFTFSYFNVLTLGNILSCYSTFDSRSLPWASFLYQCQKHGRLAGVIYGACEIFDRGDSGVGNAILDYSKAAKFIGIAFSQWFLESFPTELETLRCHVYSPSSIIRSRALAMTHTKMFWIIRNNPLKELLTLTPEGHLDFVSGDEEIFRGIVNYIYGFTKSTQEVRDELAKTNQKIRFNITRSAEDDDPSLDQTSYDSLPSINRSMLRIWGYPFQMTGPQLHEFLIGECDDYIDQDADIYGQITILFFDMASSFQTIRLSEAPRDLDDARADPGQDQKRTFVRWTRKALDEINPADFEHVVVSGGYARTKGRPVNMASVATPGIPRVDLTHLRRARGNMTTSSCKLLSLLQKLNLFPSQCNKELNIMCLGDGEGGDSRWFLDNYPHSYVYWNSKQEADNIHVPAACRILNPATLESNPHPRLIYKTQMVLGGDLTSEMVVSNITSDFRKYHLVKCDADLPKGESRGQIGYSIWSNVIKIWSLKGDINSILIIKIFFDLPELIASLFDQLTEYAETVAVCTILESHVGYEGYLIAQNPVKIALLDLVPKLPSGAITREITSITVALIADISRHQRGYLTQRERRVWVSKLPPKNIRCPFKILSHLPGLGFMSTQPPPIREIQTNLRSILESTLYVAVTEDTEHSQLQELNLSITHKLVVLSSLVKLKTVDIMIELFISGKLTRIWDDSSNWYFKLDLEDQLNQFLSSGDIFKRFRNPHSPIQISTQFYRGNHQLNLRNHMIAGFKMSCEILAYYIELERRRK